MLAEGLSLLGRGEEAIAAIGEALRRVETNGDLCNQAEALRIQANILLALPRPDQTEAEAILNQALTISRAQGALAWELRTATDLATLQTRQGRAAEARALLQPVRERFGEGFDTADLVAAAALLERLGQSSAPEPPPSHRPVLR